MTQRNSIGDVYAVPLVGGMKGYLQFIAKDSSQLFTDVIRVFKQRDKRDAQPDINAIVLGDIEFYAHTVAMKFGVSDGSWIKIGTNKNVGDIGLPLFRGSRDRGDTSVEISKQWFVWHVGEPYKYVGELKGENRLAESGGALPAKWIVIRMNTGKYHFIEPGFK